MGKAMYSALKTFQTHYPRDFLSQTTFHMFNGRTWEAHSPLCKPVITSMKGEWAKEMGKKMSIKDREEHLRRSCMTSIHFISTCLHPRSCIMPHPFHESYQISYPKVPHQYNDCTTIAFELDTVSKPISNIHAHHECNWGLVASHKFSK